MEVATLRWVVGDWNQLGDAAHFVRSQVFTGELNIDPALDFDGSDRDCIHCVAFDRQNPIATGRYSPAQTRLGRMAVLAPYRCSGAGSTALKRLLAEAVKLENRRVTLHAQDKAIPFYTRHGFAPVGAEFVEAGIVHQEMEIVPSWRSVVGAVIIRKGRVLVGRRAANLTMGNRWDIFGGKIDQNETELEALHREIREEAALNIEPEGLLDVLVYEDVNSQGWWRCPIYLVLKWHGEVTINEEHSEARWVTAAELGQLDTTHYQLDELVARVLKDF
jgi:mutator protein MutT